jgi:hypothetical protein
MVQRSRKRDYSAERARRNQEARRWGFSSLDAMSKARTRGEFPNRQTLRSDPSAGIRAMIERDNREMQAFEASRGKKVTRGGADYQRTQRNAASHDRESQAWSDAHSRQTSTAFNRRWSASKRERYYQTFVRPWGSQRSSEELDAYEEWQEEFAEWYSRRDNPYNV